MNRVCTVEHADTSELAAASNCRCAVLAYEALQGAMSWAWTAEHTGMRALDQDSRQAAGNASPLGEGDFGRPKSVCRH